MPAPFKNPLADLREKIHKNKTEREHLTGDIKALEQEREGILGIIGVSRKQFPHGPTFILSRLLIISQLNLLPFFFLQPHNCKGDNSKASHFG